MIRFAAAVAVLVAAAGAIAAEPPPELRRPLAEGERYHDPEALCSAAMPSRLPAPRSYVEIERRTVWPTSAGAAEAIRAVLELEDDHLDEDRKKKAVDRAVAQRDWAMVVIGFEARNVYNAVVALTAYCYVDAIYAVTAPIPLIFDIADPLRCTFKSLCGRP